MYINDYTDNGDALFCNGTESSIIKSNIGQIRQKTILKLLSLFKGSLYIYCTMLIIFLAYLYLPT